MAEIVGVDDVSELGVIVVELVNPEGRTNDFLN